METNSWLAQSWLTVSTQIKGHMQTSSWHPALFSWQSSTDTYTLALGTLHARTLASTSPQSLCASYSYVKEGSDGGQEESCWTVFLQTPHTETTSRHSSYRPPLAAGSMPTIPAAPSGWLCLCLRLHHCSCGPCTEAESLFCYPDPSLTMRRNLLRKEPPPEKTHKGSSALSCLPR